jgi:hypothetical protein
MSDETKMAIKVIMTGGLIVGGLITLGAVLYGTIDVITYRRNMRKEK